MKTLKKKLPILVVVLLMMFGLVVSSETPTWRNSITEDSDLGVLDSTMSNPEGPNSYEMLSPMSTLNLADLGITQWTGESSPLDAAEFGNRSDSFPDTVLEYYD
ncbi:MAG: hypothetical protein ACXABY_04925, partial [Candidatus Thorarchaeota archaeon]